MTNKPTDVLELAAERGVEFADIKFMDFIGTWQHFTIPISRLTGELFAEGVGFDGSSIRGWKNIDESDMLVVPDPATAFIDPFHRHPTISLIGDILDPITREPYSRDPRFIARKAERHLVHTGIADTAFFGPEAEFFVFDDVRFAQDASSGFYLVDSEEASWNTARAEEPNLGYKSRFKEGYFPVPPTDALQDLRSEMMKNLALCGLDPELQHHEVATAGQGEIDLHYDTLVRMGDALAIFKYVVKNTARAEGRTATFMPKPVYGDNGSGMHVHVSLWKKDTNIFDGPEYAGLSETALFFVGGVLAHAPALLALTDATTNSYKRLVPGFEAPVNLAYSQRNRSAAVRVPMYSASPGARRIEFRCPDATGNPYLTMAAILMAGLDGIDSRTHPGEPLDKNIYDMPPEELAGVRRTPPDLQSALCALEADHEFLLRGDVFTEDVVSTWIAYKRENEVTPVMSRPHPWEFYLYYDI
ncbi:MAG TPA: type I glutamate--ammonia ligase [Alphaproteobacteria bacterium]|nr:type I glutamate--ammonia ligase [Alphaproteobacteria bacterium]